VAEKLSASQKRTMLCGVGSVVSYETLHMRYYCLLVGVGLPASNIETVHPYTAAAWLTSSFRTNAGKLPQVTLRQPHSTSTDVPTTLPNNPQRNSVFTPPTPPPTKKIFFF